jgi:hypothetical protein
MANVYISEGGPSMATRSAPGALPSWVKWGALAVGILGALYLAYLYLSGSSTTDLSGGGGGGGGTGTGTQTLPGPGADTGTGKGTGTGSNGDPTKTPTPNLNLGGGGSLVESITQALKTPGQYINLGVSNQPVKGSGLDNLFVDTGPGEPTNLFPAGEVITESRETTEPEQVQVISNLCEQTGVNDWWNQAGGPCAKVSPSAAPAAAPAPVQAAPATTPATGTKTPAQLMAALSAGPNPPSYPGYVAPTPTPASPLSIIGAGISDLESAIGSGFSAIAGAL